MDPVIRRQIMYKPVVRTHMVVDHIHNHLQAHAVFSINQFEILFVSAKAPVCPIHVDMPPEYGAYHGYAATDMYRADRRFGSNEEYLELIDTAHSMGLKVIMDMIHNHVGTHHWFVHDLPSDDWIHPLDEVGTTNFRTTTIMDPYA